MPKPNQYPANEYGDKLDKFNKKMLDSSFHHELVNRIEWYQERMLDNDCTENAFDKLYDEYMYAQTILPFAPHFNPDDHKLTQADYDNWEQTNSKLKILVEAGYDVNDSQLMEQIFDAV
jgi:hypothetical protein